LPLASHDFLSSKTFARVVLWSDYFQPRSNLRDVVRGV
jgi:hypothetical protein